MKQITHKQNRNIFFIAIDENSVAV